jgi:hypothetical protein
MKEVDKFKQFLIANQCLSEKKLDKPDFKTGKISLTLAMDNFIIGNEADTFWENILKVQDVLFPDGKPKEMPGPQGASGFTGAMAAFENNPIMTDVIEQIKEMGNLDDITDVSTLIATPGFQQMVNNIKKNLQTGKYNLKHLTGTVTSVIGSVQDDLDDDTKNTLKIVTDTMGAVERNEEIDMNNLMNVVSNLKLDSFGK